MPLHLLTIAGSDPSGGAGVQADLKVFNALNTYGMSVITAITVQNTQGVHLVKALSAKLIAAQLKAIMEDIRVDAIKIGMLCNSAIIKTVFKILSPYNPIIVLDPILYSSSGHILLAEEARATMLNQLPKCSIMTPNTEELGLLCNSHNKPIEALADEFAKQHEITLVVTGGHAKKSINLLVENDGTTHEQPFKRINSPHTHGTGCVFSAALTGFFAEHKDIKKALQQATEFTTNAVEKGKQNPISKNGVSPLQV